MFYMNDVNYTTELLKFGLFADETNILGSGENSQQLLGMITLLPIQLNKRMVWQRQVIIKLLILLN